MNGQCALCLLCLCLHRYKGCRVPWLDMGVGDDYPCITVGCNPLNVNERRWGVKRS